MRSLQDDVHQRLQQAATGILPSACRRRAEKNTDCLRMLRMAHPSNHETKEMGTKTNEFMISSLSKDAFVNDVNKL